jgi:DNA-binding HxlR family transcriptional regulator
VEALDPFSSVRWEDPAVLRAGAGHSRDSQKMLIQQLHQMERDGMVRRIIHHQVPPTVEYALTDWGQALCPALDALLKWAALREEMADGVAIANKE